MSGLEMTTLGVNRVGNAILCYAWGETDRPDVFFARSAEEVRAFLVAEAFGNDKDPTLEEWMQELAKWDWQEDGRLEWEFEIGGVWLEDVIDCFSLGLSGIQNTQPENEKEGK